MSPDEPAILEGLQHRIDRCFSSKGQIELPAAPGLEPIILRRIEEIARLLGRPFSHEGLTELAGKVAAQVARSWAAGPHGTLTFSWESRAAPDYDLPYEIALAGEATDPFASWAAKGGEPFGVLPDAMVMNVAAGLPGVRVLDIGAGGGRNAFALARAGHAVDCIEPTPGFVAQIRAKASETGLPVTVTEGNILSPATEVGAGYGLALLSEVTSHFRKPEDLRRLFERLATAVDPGGAVVVNLFLADEGWEPTPLMFELAEVCWATMYTPGQLAAALEGLPFVRENLVACAQFEQENLPEGGYPPTKWYDAWANGWATFAMAKGKPPVQLTWVVLRRDISPC